MKVANFMTFSEFGLLIVRVNGALKVMKELNCRLEIHDVCVTLKNFFTATVMKVCIM